VGTARGCGRRACGLCGDAAGERSRPAAESRADAQSRVGGDLLPAEARAGGDLGEAGWRSTTRGGGRRSEISRRRSLESGTAARTGDGWRRGRETVGGTARSGRVSRKEHALSVSWEATAVRWKVKRVQKKYLMH
jgi:hypothetical protein